MKRTILILSSLLLNSFLFSCQQANSTKTNEAPGNRSTPRQEEELVERESTKFLSLNNGEKWQANAETTQGVNNLKALISAFEDSENIASYQSLAKDLKTEFQLIFKRCTMKGEAHNQLHHFLIPIKDSLDILAANDISAAKDAVVDLKKHLLLYDQYFL